MPSRDWLPIPSIEGLYEISRDGQVRRAVGGQGTRAGRFLKSHLNPRGYLIVKLCRDGKQITHTVHSLIAEVFIGPRPEGMEINHRDGVKTNNDPSNLEYVTHGRNIEHAAHMGLGVRLDADRALQVRERLAEGESVTAIANELGVSRGCIDGIKRGTTWRRATATQGASPACHARG